MLIQSNHNSLYRRPGLSLVEVMIAMVMTLVVLGAMMAAFSYGSVEMQKGRASIELNNRLIAAEEQLRRDLDRITVDLKPHHQLSSLPQGYVEIVEGPQTDYIATNAAGTFSHGGNELIFGDRDDYFACTIRSNGKPFRGRVGNQILESHFAEVAWFTVFDTTTPADLTDVLLIRRQLLIHPTPPAGELFSFTDPVAATREAAVNDYISNNDISVRVVRSGNTISVFANNLSDLTLRGNRFCHIGSVSDPALGNVSPSDSLLDIFQLGNRFNESHVIASAVASFNVQVFAPDAFQLFTPNLTATGTEISTIANPGGIGFKEGSYDDDMDGTVLPVEDSVFDAGDRNAAFILGAYVDLGQAERLTNATGSLPGTPTLSKPSNGHVMGYNPATGTVADASKFFGLPLPPLGNRFLFGFNAAAGRLSPVPPADRAGMVLYETYDTGTSQYNRDSANDPGSNGVDDETPPDGLVDEARQDLDENGLIDITNSSEVGELDAFAPYDTPIRGLRFTARVVEPLTKQVRQLTVKKSFPN